MIFVICNVQKLSPCYVSFDQLFYAGIQGKKIENNTNLYVGRKFGIGLWL